MTDTTMSMIQSDLIDCQYLIDDGRIDSLEEAYERLFNLLGELDAVIEKKGSGKNPSDSDLKVINTTSENKF
jgi:hypothetical protein